jgi:hypothetical protein
MAVSSVWRPSALTQALEIRAASPIVVATCDKLKDAALYQASMNFQIAAVLCTMWNCIEPQGSSARAARQ